MNASAYWIIHAEITTKNHYLPSRDNNIRLSFYSRAGPFYYKISFYRSGRVLQILSLFFRLRASLFFLSIIDYKLLTSSFNSLIYWIFILLYFYCMQLSYFLFLYKTLWHSNFCCSSFYLHFNLSFLFYHKIY